MTSDLSGDVRAVVEALLGPPNKALSSARDLRYGTRGSLSIDLTKATWFNHEVGEGGGMIDLVQRWKDCDAIEASDWLKTQGFSLGGLTHRSVGPRIVATYDYLDERGALLFQVVRREPKDFRQRRPDGRGGWIWSLKDVRRVLYRLPELAAADPKAPVFVVEGEKDADRLAALGLVATTSAGGAGKWRAEYGETLKGRRVAVLPDNDDPGRDHADRVLQSIAMTAAASGVLVLPRLPEKGDVSDWLDGGGDADELLNLAERALRSPKPKGATPAESASETARPTPLLRPRRQAEEIPRAALGPLRGAVEAIEARTQAPTALAMQSVLGAAALAVQAHADVETLGPDAPVSLFLLSVARSGERKSTCDRIALASLRQIERERMRERKAQLARHDDQIAVYEAEKRSILKSGDVVARDADLDALGPPPPPPLAQTILMGDPTIEGVLRCFAEGQPSIGVFSDEGGQFIGGHAMNRENRLKTAAAFSKLWDGAEINRTRGAAEAETYYGRRATVHIMLQPLIADAFFGDETLRDQGLLARMLIASPESRIGARLIELEPDGSPSSRLPRQDEKALEAFGARIAELLERAPATEDGSSQELKPRRLSLAPDARTLLVDFFNETERAQAEGGPLVGIRSVASKAPEQAARIAGVLTLFEDLDAEQVKPQTMADAITLGAWFLGEAQRLLDDGGITPETMAAESLRHWLIETWREDAIDVRTIVQRGPNALRDTARVRKLIPILERNGWLLRKEDGEPKERRRREGWRIVRK